MAEHNRLGFFLIFMLILLLTPDGGPVTSRNDTEQAIQKAKGELEALRNSSYGIPGNITGFSGVGKPGPDGLVVVVPPTKVRTTVQEMIRKILAEDAEPDGTKVHEANKNSTRAIPTTYIPQSGDDTSQSLGDNTSGSSEDGIQPLATTDGEKPRQTHHEAEHMSAKRDNLQPTYKEYPFYYNASGGIHGKWRRLYDLPPYILTNFTNGIENNITGNYGRLTIRIEESRVGEVQEAQARISFENEDGLDNYDVIVHGVHITKSGDMILTTNSREFSGLFALPHFTLSSSDFETTRAMLSESLSETIKRQEKSPDSNIIWSTPLSSTSDRRYCEYIVYLQLHPIHSASSIPNKYPLYHPLFWYHYFFDATPITSPVLRLIEKELRHPTGAPIPPAPPIVLDGIIYSPNCGFVLGTNNARGIKAEQFNNRLTNFALSVSVVVGLQTWLLIRQMNESSTPSTVSRVSFWSIAMLAIVDGYMAGAFILVSVMVESSYLALVTAAFLSFVLVVVFGMRFLITIWGIQRPERRAATAAAAAAATAAAAAAAAATPAPTPAPAPTSATRNLLPIPAIATATAQSPLVVPQNGTPPANTNPPDDTRQDISTIYSRFYFILIGGAFLFLHVSTWSPSHRHLFVSICAFLACSFWVPQIYRNIMRGCRKALSWEFVLGTSIYRILPIIYLFCFPNGENPTEGNIFSFEFLGMEKIGFGVVGWVSLQVFILWTQEWAGPRVGIPRDWLPSAYDYHPILPVDDLEAAQPFSAATPTSPQTPTSTHGHTHGRPGLRSFDCAICMHPVEVITAAGGGEGGREVGVGGVGGGIGGLVTRRSYMVTPCRHVFHAMCLEGWMRMRLQCPICRNQLPPL